MLKESSAYHDLLSPFFQPDSPDLQDWVNSPYEKNTKHPERLIHETLSGEFVRSKSESMIAMSLQTHHLPFRYECALQLGEVKVFPDFTILHPVTRKVFYWEHLGMLDVRDYLRKAVSKLELYGENGYYPGNQLIITSESKDEPLTTMSIEKTIQHYFL